MRLRFADDHREAWPVTVLCSVLQVPTAGHHAWRPRPEGKRAAENRALLDGIRQVHDDSQGRHGSARAHAALRAGGGRVGRRRVERIMRHHGARGLIARRRRVQTAGSRHAFPAAPNLLERKLSAASRPNQVWLADLTCIATGEGWLHAAAIMDLHTRKPDAERQSEQARRGAPV